MKKIYSAVFIFALLVPLAGRTQSTLVLRPGPASGKDAMLHKLFTAKNYADNLDIISFGWTFDGEYGTGTSVFEFDVTAVPANMSIITARLSLYHNPASTSAGQAGDNASYLKRVTSDWNENTVTGAFIPSVVSEGQVFLAASGSGTQDYPDVDITHFVQYWYDHPDSNFGMMLCLIDTNIYRSMKFCSSDCADTARRPKLEIVYAPSGPAVPAAVLNQASAAPQNILIYPNPSQNNFFVEFTSEAAEGQIIVCDESGRIVYSHILNKAVMEIDCGPLSHGMYFVKIYSGRNFWCKKIIHDSAE